MELIPQRKRKLVHRKVADLVPYARNSRTHSDAQVDQLAASIREFGWTNPILVDEAGGIIAGHGRLLAAHKLGIKEAPCVVIDGLSEAQRRALVIADNKLAMNAGWDEELLASEILGLGDEGFDLALLGFDADELAALLADKTDGLTDPDDVPEVPALGDVWLLGKHRLVCGDSTEAATVVACLDGAKPHLMVTDPPYGVEYDPQWRNRVKRPNGKVYGAMATGQVLNDDQDDWSAAWVHFTGDVAYVWQGDRQLPSMAQQLLAAGFQLRNLIVWAKTRFVISRGDYHSLHETCWYAVRKGKVGHWSGDRSQTTRWDIEHAKSDTGHSTQKPVECMKRPIENNSKPDDTVYEPFSGSGTTIIAGEMTGRSIHAIELNPAYVDVAVIRWMEFTGQTAVHAESGRTFGEERAARAESLEAA